MGEKLLKNNYTARYKVFLWILKILPMIISLVYILNIILSYFNVNTDILRLSFGLSFFICGFLIFTSFIFSFCIYHRIFLYYIILNDAINIYDFYWTVPISDVMLVWIHLLLYGISLFISLFLYKKHDSNYKSTPSQDYRKNRRQ